MGFEEELISAIEGDFVSSNKFTPAEKAAIKWAEILTEKTYRGENPQAMPELKKHYTHEQIVEITMVSCMFNFWNRFTDSLQIDIEDSPVMGKFSKSKKLKKTDYISFMCDCWWNK